MILSFHPNIVADENILCASRPPSNEDQAAVCRAKAVILPQGCSEALYKVCRNHCFHVFPNYDMRFDFPGKLGQARLFQKFDAPFPLTFPFESVSSYFDHHPPNTHRSPLHFPCVFKFDWGGEGEGVFLLETAEELKPLLERAKRLEKSGQKGFLLQEYVPCHQRSLRVVVVGDRSFSYWRKQQNHSQFHTNLKAGAIIDHQSDRGLQEAGKAAVKDFCSKTGINLAGFDLLFAENDNEPAPLFLEINYFFGRRGFGGSLEYYKLVEKAVRSWLNGIGLSL